MDVLRHFAFPLSCTDDRMRASQVNYARNSRLVNCFVDRDVCRLIDRSQLVARWYLVRDQLGLLPVLLAHFYQVVDGSIEACRQLELVSGLACYASDKLLRSFQLA